MLSRFGPWRRIASRSKAAVAVLVGAATLSSALAPAFADTYTTGSGGVCVGTNGSDAVSQWGSGCGLFPAVAVSQGGCAYGTHVAVAVGESGRCTNGAEAQGIVAVGLMGADVTPWNCCGPSVGVSDSGYVWNFSPFGGVTVSGTGDAMTTSTWGAAASGTGNATDYGCYIVLSYCVGGAAVSGTGSAYGAAAVSGTGTATGLTAVSGTGHADGSTAAVSGTGSASGGVVAVAGDDANANGGLASVSLTGNGGGGSVTNVCPMGHCG